MAFIVNTFHLIFWIYINYDKHTQFLPFKVSHIDESLKWELFYLSWDPPLQHAVIMISCWCLLYINMLYSVMWYLHYSRCWKWPPSALRHVWPQSTCYLQLFEVLMKLTLCAQCFLSSSSSLCDCSGKSCLSHPWSKIRQMGRQAKNGN